MSYIDIATLTVHRRHELENRIHSLENKCDCAISNIRMLKMTAKSFVSQLNCEPSELKDRFLHVMQKLEEYMYVITDFNLALAQTDTTSTDFTPVQDTSLIPGPSLSPYNLIDALTEPLPSTSCAFPNLCLPQKPVRAMKPNEDQRLIVFSSSSSAESVPRNTAGQRPDAMKDSKETQCQIMDGVANLAIKDTNTLLRTVPPLPALDVEEGCRLPAQGVLEVDHKYTATIISTEAGCFSVIIGDLELLAKLMSDMTSCYERHPSRPREEEVHPGYCAYYDDDLECYYRALLINKLEGEPAKVELFVVDTGEIREVPVEYVRRLLPQFCKYAPFARTCHLAGVDLGTSHDSKLMEKQKEFMNEYLGNTCTIEVDDNSSESLGVYVLLDSNLYLNNIIVDRGLATHLEPVREKPVPALSAAATRGPPADSDELGMELGPEYDDPVEAVTGYHNRDEVDICKYYKGGTDKTCFKGARCTKKHILKHPDGWTYDRVGVVGKCELVPLPAPGSWLKVLVTCVEHFDRVSVQIQHQDEQDEVPVVGLMLPPRTLRGLQRDMNSPASVLTYKHMTISPAPGEIVAALYPLDNQWYRAKVITAEHSDQSVEIVYVDYGTHMWVKEDQIRVLEARFMSVPAQAVQCTLAGCVARSQDSKQWALAKRALQTLIQDKIVDAHVVAREFNHLVVELFDESQHSVAEVLEARGLANLVEFSVADDAHLTQKVVPS